jgi:hypothetical protein
LSRVTLRYLSSPLTLHRHLSASRASTGPEGPKTVPQCDSSNVEQVSPSLGNFLGRDFLISESSRLHPFQTCSFLSSLIATSQKLSSYVTPLFCPILPRHRLLRSQAGQRTPLRAMFKVSLPAANSDPSSPLPTCPIKATRDYLFDQIRSTPGHSHSAAESGYPTSGASLFAGIQLIR